MIFELVAPSGAGKTYSVKKLSTHFEYQTHFTKVLTRETMKVDSKHAFIALVYRIKLIVFCIFLYPARFLQIVKLIHRTNKTFKNSKKIDKFILSYVMFYNLAAVFQMRGRDCCFLLDQGPFQVLTSYAIRCLDVEVDLKPIVSVFIETLPSDYYVVSLDYTINKIQKNLALRNSPQDAHRYRIYYESNEKINQTFQIFRCLLKLLSENNKVIRDTAHQNLSWQRLMKDFK